MLDKLRRLAVKGRWLSADVPNHDPALTKWMVDNFSGTLTWWDTTNDRPQLRQVAFREDVLAAVLLTLQEQGVEPDTMTHDFDCPDG